MPVLSVRVIRPTNDYKSDKYEFILSGSVMPRFFFHTENNFVNTRRYSYFERWL